MMKTSELIEKAKLIRDDLELGDFTYRGQPATTAFKWILNEAIKNIEAQDKRIAELEAENSNLHGHLTFTHSCNCDDRR